jgi:hypothetical protein
MTRNAAGILIIALAACAKAQGPAPDVMSIGWCDSTPMKPLGRVAQLPDALPVPGFGTLIGVVVQAETNDALPSAGVKLVSVAGDTSQSKSERAADSKGGFKFDSVFPGSYQLRVRRVGESKESLAVAIRAGRLDTVRIRMRAYRCYGY